MAKNKTAYTTTKYKRAKSPQNKAINNQTILWKFLADQMCVISMYLIVCDKQIIKGGG